MGWGYKDGKLSAFGARDIVVMRGWPAPMAWRRTRTKPWQPTRKHADDTFHSDLAKTNLLAGHIDIEPEIDNVVVAPGERGFTRGANCTSVDAVMLGVRSDQSRVLFLIEWKYTESYRPEDLYIPARAQVYDSLIRDPGGPFVPGIDPQSLYYEPFYQMMRQTLLAWQFEKHEEHGCSQCINVHVIPDQNREMKTAITSPGLSGQDIHDAWRSVLKEPDKYIPIDPAALLQSTVPLPDTQSWLAYLRGRYW